MSCRSVHPHVRGENAGRQIHFLGVGRFTPTCVGKIKAIESSSYASTVHPHVRGENSLGFKGRLGSQRFTPTRVGKITVIIAE